MARDRVIVSTLGQPDRLAGNIQHERALVGNRQLDITDRGAHLEQPSIGRDGKFGEEIDAPRVGTASRRSVAAEPEMLRAWPHLDAAVDGRCVFAATTSSREPLTTARVQDGALGPGHRTDRPP